MKTKLQILCLFAFFPLSEIYIFLGKGIYVHPYFLDKNIQESIRWYVNDIVQSLNWIVVFVISYYREMFPGVEKELMTKALRLLISFKTVDFAAYLANHRHAGWIYSIAYLILLIYAGRQQFRKQQLVH